MLEDHTHAQADPAQVALAERRDVLAEHLDAPAVGLLEPVQAADERRFSRAAAADDSDDLAALDLERHALDRRRRAEALADVDEAQHRLALRLSSRGGRTITGRALRMLRQFEINCHVSFRCIARRPSSGFAATLPREKGVIPSPSGEGGARSSPDEGQPRVPIARSGGGALACDRAHGPAFAG